MSYKALTSNTIYVNSVNDLPAPVSGVRTLATGTTYYFGALITDSNALKIPNGANVSLIGLDNQRSGFVYTGTGNGNVVGQYVFNFVLLKRTDIDLVTEKKR